MSRRLPSALLLLALLLASQLTAAESWPLGLQRIRERAPTPLVVVEDGQSAIDILLGQDSQLIRNAADWIGGFVERSTGASIAIGPLAETWPKEGGLKEAERKPTLRSKSHVIAVVGDQAPLVKQLVTAGRLQLEPRVGPQGFVLQRLTDPALGETLICWSPGELGCRYGLIEILRSIRVAGKSATIDLGRVVDGPQFPLRICYVNFAEHLQNAFNPNVLFDVPVNRWSDVEWDRFIDMISGYRYNVFEFWLVPTLFSSEALKGGKIPTEFAAIMNRVIAYAKTRGVAVHPIQAVNTIGQQWYCACPKDAQDHDQIVALWDHWSKTFRGNQFIGFFPGDPGGCFRNGCTAETYVDLCLELSRIVRRNNPGVTIEIGTWGDPMAGWGVPLWTGKPERAQQAMKYFFQKLPEFPPDTFTSINLGFSPDCLPTHGGDGRPSAQHAAKTHRVLTWDYSVTEGEGTVSPRCRVRRMFQRRREELALGCYSGGICYTMAPKLNCASIFCCAEAYWNPALEPDSVLADFGRFTFGDELAGIGPLLEEFEVIPDWGYYPPFPYSPQRLEASIAKLLPLLERVGADWQPRLPLGPTMAEYRRSLLFYADLFRRLATVAVRLDEVAAVAKAAGKTAASRNELVSLDELRDLLLQSDEYPQKPRLRELAAELEQLDVRALTKSYWDTVYGIYGVIPHPVDPRAQGATSTLFSRFHCSLAIEHPPSVLEKALKVAGKPHRIVDLGSVISEREWKLSGWTLQGEDDGETWRASFDAPGIIGRDDFLDQGYRWLVVRLTEGPQGGKKTIAVNGTVIGKFVRSGPAVTVRKEWWVTRSYPIPEGLLQSGKLEIRFTDPGIAISAVALAAERLPDTE
ncbi:MAG: hypothetical protein NTY19_37410 [Planctomycetota bacterium]|nr:hypothetical protein [Planctomycetota bacterium]